MVLENRVLRIIFGSKRDKIIGEWKRVRNEEFVICTLRQMLFV
jgi:hypothetical protein